MMPKLIYETKFSETKTETIKRKIVENETFEHIWHFLENFFPRSNFPNPKFFTQDLDPKGQTELYIISSPHAYYCRPEFENVADLQYLQIATSMPITN